MTEAPKPGRPRSPCKKCGGAERNAAGACIPCSREYQRAYRKAWIAKRKKEMKQSKKKG